MSWSSIKRSARLAVHRQFAVPATYTAPALGSPTIDVSVRHHTRIARFGDLDREGYGQVIEDINRVIFLQDEVTPERLGLIEFDDGRKYTVEFVVPPEDDLTITCEVKPKK